MQFGEYQYEQYRTRPDEVDIDQVNLSIWGMMGELGEVVEHLKKYQYHDHDLDVEKIKEEMGDILWYFSNLATTFNLKLEDIAQFNVNKLKVRYPDGFDPDRSKNRKEYKK